MPVVLVMACSALACAWHLLLLQGGTHDGREGMENMCMGGHTLNQLFVLFDIREEIGST